MSVMGCCKERLARIVESEGRRALRRVNVVERELADVETKWNLRQGTSALACGTHPTLVLHTTIVIFSHA